MNVSEDVATPDPERPSESRNITPASWRRATVPYVPEGSRRTLVGEVVHRPRLRMKCGATHGPWP